MKKIRLLALALCFIFVLAPLTVLAEGPDADAGYDMDPLCLKFETQEDYDALIPRKAQCSAELEGGALKLTAKDLPQVPEDKSELFIKYQPDPRIWITFKNLSQKVNAEDYPFITLIYRMPETARPETEYFGGHYLTEIFCNTNDTEPRGDQSVTAAPKVTGDKYAALTFKPGNLTEWKGVITSLRLDFFAFAYEGDVMYVHNILLSKTSVDAQIQSKKIIDQLNAPNEMTLKFNVGKYGTAPADQIVKKGENPIRPEDPTAEGVIFDDWYTASNYIEKFDFNSPLSKAITTVYGKWSKVFTVSFNDGIGETPVAVKVKANSRVERPADPVREGYTFRGWYTDEDCKTEYSFGSIVKNDITLYAKWDEGVFFPVTVVGGTADVADGRKGDTVTVTAADAPEGKMFDKWEVVSGGVTLADAGAVSTTFVMGETAVELKATYKDIEYTVTVTGGSASVEKAASGADVTVTAGEAPEGNEFDKWVVVSGNVTLADEKAASTTFKMGTANVEIRAEYKAAFTPGDVNGDNSLDAKDIILIMRYIVAKNVKPIDTFNEAAADFNGDKSVDAKDIILIMRQIIANSKK